MKIISAKQRADKTFTAHVKNKGISPVFQALLNAMDEAEKQERFFADVRDTEPLNGTEAAYLNTLGYRVTSTALYNGNVGPNGKYDHYINW